MTNWFEVDKEGLRKLFQHKSRAFAVLELIQNAWDESGVTEVDVTLKPIPNRSAAKLVVRDDAPEGFKDLAHAFTLFAESHKKNDPTLRGRFNLGEKLVLALCEEASIKSTTGTVNFGKDGRTRSRSKTEAGSVFEATLLIDRKGLQEARQQVFRLFPPPGIKTTFNGDVVPYREPLKEFEVTLPTLTSDEEGNLRPTRRKTSVAVYEKLNGESASLYELGLPVVETGDRWHVNIGQKVPLTLERDNVTPSYLRKVRVYVLNNMADEIDKDDATTWARDAVSDRECSTEAVNRSLDLRFGKKRVAYDPSDPEANSRAFSQGYTVIHGSSLSRDEWDSVRRSEAAPPAGQITPSPRPFSDDPDAPEVDKILPEDWTDDQRRTVNYVESLSQALVRSPVHVDIIRLPGFYSATYCRGRLSLNFNRLGKRFFQGVTSGDVDTVDECHLLIIHELAHHYESDHLSSRYHEACCKLGARLARILLDHAKLKRVPA